MDQREGSQGRRRQGPPPQRQARSKPYAGSREPGRSRSRDDGDFARERPQRKRSQRVDERPGGRDASSRDRARRARDDRDRPMRDAPDGRSRGRYERGERGGSRRNAPRKKAPASSRGIDERSRRIFIIAAIVILILIIVGIAKCAGGGDSDGQVEGEGAVATEQMAENGEAAQTGVESPWTESGYFSSGDETFDARLKDYCDQHTPEDGEAEDGAREMYEVIVAMDHEITDYNQDPGGSGWELTYAKQILDANAGNNYEKSALIAQTLRYFGYDAVAQPCIVDGETAGLVIVAGADGGQLVCSPALGSAGWMLQASSINYQIDNEMGSGSSGASGDSSGGSGEGSGE